MLQYRGARSGECALADAAGNPLIARFGGFIPLDLQEVSAINALCTNQQEFAAGQVIMQEGSRPETVSLILSGLAFLFKHPAAGRRQIVGYRVPGDFCDVRLSELYPLDYSVAALGPVRVATIPTHNLRELLERRPGIERAFALAELLDMAMLREWLLNIGQRNAQQKLCHFLCEMSVRLRAVGMVNGDGSVELPLDQAVLADTTGLTLVHINRTLQQMRRAGLVELGKRRLKVSDPERLAAIAEFDPTYLRIEPGLSAAA